METLVTEGQPLFDLGLEQAKKFSEEEVLQWTAATLTEDGVKAETIQKAVQAMRDQEVDGEALSDVTYERLVSHPYNLPGGPAGKLARRIQSLAAKKAARRSRKLVSFFRKESMPKHLVCLCSMHAVDLPGLEKLK